MESRILGITEIELRFATPDNGRQTTDNGGQSRLIAQGSRLTAFLYPSIPFRLLPLALSLRSVSEALRSLVDL